MEKIIALLQEKNHQLEKFYWVNEQELINFGVGNFDTVEEFYQAREVILEVIHQIDGLIEQENESGKEDSTVKNRLEAQKAEVESLLNSRDELVKSILAQDLQILTYIEREKSNIIRDLKATANAKKAVGAYANSERTRQIDSE